MRTATIQGHVTSTVKHKSLGGHRMLIAIPEDGGVPPQIVLDSFGAGIGQRVIISSDGAEARQLVRDESSPARWTVMGIIDPVGGIDL